MKIAISRPKLHSVATKTVLVVMSLVIAISAPIQMSQRLSALTIDDINAAYNAKKSAIQQDIDSYNAQLSQLAAQTNTLQTAIAALDIQKAEIQAQINLSQAQYDELVAKIADTEQKIKDNQDALGTTISNMYVDSNVTPLEMLASSSSINDYMDKQEYQSSIRNQLTSTITEIKNLKTALVNQKADLEAVLAKQNAQKDVLVAKQTEQQVLLDKTKGQEATYQQLSAQKAAELANAYEQQRLAIAKLTNNGQNTSGSVGSFAFRNYSGEQDPCSSGYPASALGIYNQAWGCNYPLDYPYDESRGIYYGNGDDWALYNRECVSYAAWAAYNRFGKKVTSFMGMGFAYQWPTTALSMGANVDNTPEVGSVAISSQISYYGHAMVVEQVYGDGWIKVSQFNFDVTGRYSTMDLKASSAVYVHFQDR